MAVTKDQLIGALDPTDRLIFGMVERCIDKLLAEQYSGDRLEIYLDAVKHEISQSVIPPSVLHAVIREYEKAGWSVAYHTGSATMEHFTFS